MEVKLFTDLASLIYRLSSNIHDTAQGGPTNRNLPWFKETKHWNKQEGRRSIQAFIHQKVYNIEIAGKKNKALYSSETHTKEAQRVTH